MHQVEYYCEKCDEKHFGNCPKMKTTVTTTSDQNTSTNTLELKDVLWDCLIDFAGNDEKIVSKQMEIIDRYVSQAVNKARIEEMKMMRDLIHLFKVNPIEQMQGKTSFNEYIKKRLGELETPNQVEREK